MELKNPPIIDIEFKLWWHLTSDEELILSEFLKGDLFHLIKVLILREE